MDGRDFRMIKLHNGTIRLTTPLIEYIIQNFSSFYRQLSMLRSFSMCLFTCTKITGLISMYHLYMYLKSEDVLPDYILPLEALNSFKRSI